jgi:hypothetical protein
MTFSRRLVSVLLLLAATITCGSPPTSRSTEPAAPSSATQPSSDPRVGTRVYLTGCERGELVVQVINLWDSPARSRIVGKLSGSVDGGCLGAIVTIRDVQGRLVEVETTYGDPQRGWITEPFIGRPAS